MDGIETLEQEVVRLREALSAEVKRHAATGGRLRVARNRATDALVKIAAALGVKYEAGDDPSGIVKAAERVKALESFALEVRRALVVWNMPIGLVVNSRARTPRALHAPLPTRHSFKRMPPSFDVTRDGFRGRM